jgi:hypothetical protein
LFEFKEGENFNHPSGIGLAPVKHLNFNGVNIPLGRQEYIEYFQD